MKWHIKNQPDAQARASRMLNDQPSLARRARLCFETHPTGLVPVERGLCTIQRHRDFEVVQRPVNHPDKRGGVSKQRLVERDYGN